MTFLTILILSFIEGLTEFLPVSSTGHLILVSAWLGINEDVFVQNFNIVIQFGAIGSVLVLYWRRFFPIRPLFYSKLLVAFLPAAILGVLFKSRIEALLDSVQVVATALLLGGVVLIWIDKKMDQLPPKQSLESLSYKSALLIGLVQCLAFVPGVSRAAATILGGLGIGLSRKEATEFSFFLAVPTLMAAGLYKGYKALPSLSMEQLQSLGLGVVLSFIFALIAIRFFVELVKKFGLAHFGWYRILLGAGILIALWRGHL